MTRPLSTPLVLDRNEREEALELARAPELLLVAERRGTEALERRLDLSERGVDRPVVAVPGSGDERAECVRGCRCLGRAALLLVRRSEHGEVPVREGGGARAADVEALVARCDHRVECRAEPRLVGVEEVGPNCCRRLLGAHPAGLERLEGQRGVGAGTGEARRLAELPHKEPGARLVHVARGGGGSGAFDRLGEDCRPRRGASDLERHRLSSATARPAASSPGRAAGSRGPSSKAAAFATRFLALSGSSRTSARCASARVVRTSAAACQGSWGAAEAVPARARQTAAVAATMSGRSAIQLLLDRHPELGGGLRDLAGNRRRAVLCLGAEHLGLLGLEAPSCSRE